MEEQGDLDPDEAVRLAAHWILERDQRNQSLFSEMRQRHGLTTPQCIEAVKLAKLLREGGADAQRS